MIDFFIRNLNFTQQGFYKGFGELLYNMIVSDRRAVSDTWLVSVLLKIASLGVTDSDYRQRVQNLLDVNCERLSANALVKFVVLELAINQGKMLMKHKDLIIRRLRVFNPENVHEIRMVTQLALCVA
jgi:hypothetical protein